MIFKQDSEIKDIRYKLQSVPRIDDTASSAPSSVKRQLGPLKSKKPPLGHSDSVNKDLQIDERPVGSASGVARSKKLRRDHVIENKLRLLKENMIRSGNADIADLADRTDFDGDMCADG